MYKKLLPLCTKIPRPNANLDMYLHTYGEYSMDELTGVHIDCVDNVIRVVITTNDNCKYKSGINTYPHRSVDTLVEYLDRKVSDDFSDDVITKDLYAFDPDGEYKEHLDAVDMVTKNKPDFMDLGSSILRRFGEFDKNNAWIWDYGKLDNSSEDTLFSIHKEIDTLSSKDELYSVIQNCSPSYDSIQLPLIQSCGIHDGGYYGTWTWREDKLRELSIDDLREIYRIVRKVYKKPGTEGLPSCQRPTQE